MNGRFKLVVTAHCVTQRLHETGDKLLSRVEPPKEEMATLDIPSLPSSDLNHMLKFVLSPNRAPHRTWPVKATVEDDGERSPEPRTPKFGANDGPTFAESNAQFGFHFPTSISKPFHKPELVSVQATATDTAHFLVSANSHSSTGINIPTTVIDQVGESSKNSGAEELPTIMLSNGEGKPASFIRFLNEPIPLNTVNVEHQEVNIDKYRTSGTAHEIVSDLDAIQRMEEEPVELAQITSDQCVPGSSGVQYCEVISDDSSAPSQTELLEDVAAYQCVEETPTYAELQPRKLSEVNVPLTLLDPMPFISDSEPMSVSESETMSEHLSMSEGFTHHTDYLERQTQAQSDQMEDHVEKLNQEITRDLETALQSAPEETKVQILLKNELKHKIQLKRLQQGKTMLQVSFESRPIGEPSEEEKTKAHNRKMKNRESAVRSRQKRQELMDTLEKEVKSLERENKKMMREIQELKEGNSKLISSRCHCMKNNQPSADQTVLIIPVPSQCGDGTGQLEADQETLSEAIANLLAAEGKT